MLIAIDVETGGLDPQRHPILSIAAVTEHGGCFSQLVLPCQTAELDAAALSVNGFSRSDWMAAGAVDEAEALRRFAAWLRELGTDLSPVAHNAAFDRGFLKEAADCCGVPLPLSHRWECSQASLLFAMRAGIVPPGSASLDRLAALSGRSRSGFFHGAKEDAHLCLHGYLWLVDRVRRATRPSLGRRLLNLFRR